MAAEPHTKPTPALEPGLNIIDVPAPRSPALHQLVHETLLESRGEALWIDARNNAVTNHLHHPHSRRQFVRIRAARAFTAYQHHELIRTLPSELTDDTPLVVAPCLTSLYHDDDIPSPEDATYLRSSTAILTEISETFDTPVLASCVHTGPLRETIDEYATKTITVEETTQGYRYETPGFETLVYWNHGYWQTTIPYWVDLLDATTENCTMPYAIADERITATV